LGVSKGLSRIMVSFPSPEEGNRDKVHEPSYPVIHHLQNPLESNCNDVTFEVFTAVTMKTGVFWDVTPCGSCKNRRFGGT
jgi:hypothetical protein